MATFDSIQTSLTLLRRVSNPKDPSLWQEGWESFWRRYAGFVRAWARRLRRKGYLLDDATLDDVVVEVMANLQRTIAKPGWTYEAGGNFQGYVARAVDNTVKRLAKRRQNELAMAMAGGSNLYEQLLNVPAVHSLAASLSGQMNEDFGRIMAAWETALGDCRVAQAREAAEQIILRGRPASEVAQDLEITVGAAKMAALRVRKRLRLLLADLDRGPGAVDEQKVAND